MISSSASPRSHLPRETRVEGTRLWVAREAAREPAGEWALELSALESAAYMITSATAKLDTSPDQDPPLMWSDCVPLPPFVFRIDCPLASMRDAPTLLPHMTSQFVSGLTRSDVRVFQPE